MEIEFPVQSTYDRHWTSVAFPVLIDGEKHRCLVAEEALHDNFEEQSSEPAALVASLKPTGQKLNPLPRREYALVSAMRFF